MLNTLIKVTLWIALLGLGGNIYGQSNSYYFFYKRIAYDFNTGSYYLAVPVKAEEDSAVNLLVIENTALYEVLTRNKDTTDNYSKMIYKVLRQGDTLVLPHEKYEMLNSYTIVLSLRDDYRRMSDEEFSAQIQKYFDKGGCEKLGIGYDTKKGLNFIANMYYRKILIRRGDESGQYCYHYATLDDLPDFLKE